VEFDLDINASRGRYNLQHDHVLTSRPVRRALAGFGLALYPPELNFIEVVPGELLSLARREDVLWDGWAEREARRRLHQYFWQRNRSSRRRDAGFTVARWVQAARQKLGL
jgi:hypothetical protein